MPDVTIEAPSGLVLYCIVSRSDGLVARLVASAWTLEAYDVAHIAGYAIALPETPGGSGLYPFTFPPVTSGIYRSEYWLRAGGSPVGPPADAPIGSDEWSRSGAAPAAPLSGTPPVLGIPFGGGSIDVVAVRRLAGLPDPSRAVVRKIR